MAHITVPEAEKIIDKEIKVLDHGFVRLVDYMGSDARIVQTARVSYGEGTKTLREDAGLIDYLLRHEHSSPFEHVIFEFHAKMPIFVARQWIRHRTARLNEISGRYSVIKDEFYIPEASSINFQSKDNKQGRAIDDVPVELKEKVISLLAEDQQNVYKNYEEMIDDDIARELARINLPLSTYTEWYWQMDLKNMFHFLKLRMDHHAQWEIQEYGRAMAKIVKAVCPLAYESFERHMVNGARFSSHELDAIKEMLNGKPNPLEGRKLAEFKQKLNSND
ncbi:MAG: FAD-dependent thymidylate synthase [Pontiellaceae bacterium]